MPPRLGFALSDAAWARATPACHGESAAPAHRQHDNGCAPHPEHRQCEICIGLGLAGTYVAPAAIGVAAPATVAAAPAPLPRSSAVPRFGQHAAEPRGPPATPV
jgi:hypothetical protein